MNRRAKQAAGAAIVATLAAAAAWRVLAGAGPARAQGDVVRRGPLAIEAPATGVLAAARSVDVTAPISANPHFFKIARLAPEGVRVRSGDTIMELDVQEVKRQAEDDRAEAGKTKDQRGKRQLEYDLMLRDLRVRIEEARVQEEAAGLRQSIEPHLLPAQERRQYQLEFEQAREAHALLDARLAATAQMKTSELAVLDRTLANVELRLQRARALQEALTVKAPIAGTLIYKVMADGAKRKVGEQTCHHEVILQIPDLSTLRIEAMVNEEHAGALRVGQLARIRLDALPDLPLTGRVTAVGAALHTKRDNPIKVVDVLVDLGRPDARLSPGMTATLRIEVDRVADALLAPLQFVHERDGRAFLRVAGPDGRIEERVVRPGRRSGPLVEILEGAAEGDRLSM